MKETDIKNENEQISPIWECKCGITNDLRENIQCSCGKYYGEIA